MESSFTKNNFPIKAQQKAPHMRGFVVQAKRVLF
tara:strand:- start:386 stop:487 length:102 start_codon:yes stop_codon:yes gene_type:complete